MIQFKLLLISYFIFAIVMSDVIFGFGYFDLISWNTFGRIIVNAILFIMLSYAWDQGEKEFMVNMHH
jgi:hypothetical protein